MALPLLKIVPQWLAIKTELKQTCLRKEKTHFIGSILYIRCQLPVLNYVFFPWNILSKLVKDKKKIYIIHILSPYSFFFYAPIYLTTKPTQKKKKKTYTHTHTWLSTTFVYTAGNESSHLFFLFLWDLLGALRMPLGILRLSRLCNLTSPKSNLTLYTYLPKGIRTLALCRTRYMFILRNNYAQKCQKKNYIVINIVRYYNLKFFYICLTIGNCFNTRGPRPIPEGSQRIFINWWCLVSDT